jgi:hypothetical protein
MLFLLTYSLSLFRDIFFLYSSFSFVPIGSVFLFSYYPASGRGVVNPPPRQSVSPLFFPPIFLHSLALAPHSIDFYFFSFCSPFLIFVIAAHDFFLFLHFPFSFEGYWFPYSVAPVVRLWKNPIP